MRQKILITAFSCHPQRGSEPGVGHYFVSELAKHYKLTVITETVENRGAILERQQMDPVYAGIDFHFLTWPKLKLDGTRMDDTNPFTYFRLLRSWERAALRLATNLCNQQRFAFTHHLTMQGYREPGFMWSLPLPFVWGPVGGHAQIPWRFFSILGFRGMCEHAFRNCGNWVQGAFHRRVRRAVQRSRALIVNTSAERKAMSKLYGVEADVVAEFGPELATCDGLRRGVKTPLKVVWSGVHVPRKGLPILLRAAALIAHDLDFQLHILGSGPETNRWKRMAAFLKIEERCVWHGRLPREQALKVMSEGDVFALTSLLDGTSCVLNEALSLGLPVICHRCCGFPDIVDETCAFLVPFESPGLSVAGFEHALRRFFQQPMYLEQLAEGARERMRSLSENSPASKMVSIYEKVLNQASSRS